MDPILSISKVFSLVVQEERQRSISYGILSSLSPVGISGPSSSMAATNFTSKPRRDRPLYTHCGLQGHTMEKCYKLHGSMSTTHYTTELSTARKLLFHYCFSARAFYFQLQWHDCVISHFHIA
ncbi:hypothetical protein CK203_097045 [Vitis vinifera]|uniref:Uncharacterized protein n=1 Tax=Vitis vinifera TaxID=29760 RepID=A0A438E7B2_VITVI|nr:hypothetical protein CK203_097045 [Vitis vinifera]